MKRSLEIECLEVECRCRAFVQVRHTPKRDRLNVAFYSACCLACGRGMDLYIERRPGSEPGGAR